MQSKNIQRSINTNSNASFRGSPFLNRTVYKGHSSTCLFTAWFVDVNDLKAQAEQYFSDGDIDSTTNQGGQRVAIWHEQFDFAVNPSSTGTAPFPF